MLKLTENVEHVCLYFLFVLLFDSFLINTEMFTFALYIVFE